MPLVVVKPLLPHSESSEKYRTNYSTRVCRTARCSRQRLPKRALHALSNVRVPSITTTNAATQGNVNEFWDWMRANKVVEDNAALRPAITDEGIGLVATRSLSAEEVVLKVPESLFLNAQAAAQSPIGPYCAGLKPWIAVALHLILEKATPNSKWGPYLKLLPEQLDLPVHWSDEELAELQGTQVLQTTLGYTQYVQAEYAQLEGSVFQANAAAFPADVFTFDAFLWAFSILRSRTHAPFSAESIALVPGADLLNHSSAGGAAVQAQGPGLFGLTQAAATLHLQAPIQQDDQLRMDYGRKTDSELLVDFGFVARQAPLGGYALSLAIPPEDVNFDDKVDLAEVAGFAGQTTFVLSGTAAVDNDLMTFLRLMQLRGQDSFLLEALFRDNAWELISLPVSAENERLVCESMIYGCKEALAAYPTSLAQDDRMLLKAESLPYRLQLALQARVSEKRAIQSTLAFFEQHIQELDTLEYYQERRLKSLGLLDESGESTYDDPFSEAIA